MYGDGKELKTIIKKLQIESVEESKIKFFHNLNRQFHQKVITLFGSKLRMYENSNKEKKKNIENITKVKSSLHEEEKKPKMLDFDIMKKDKEDKIENKSEE